MSKMLWTTFDRHTKCILKSTSSQHWASIRHFKACYWKFHQMAMKIGIVCLQQRQYFKIHHLTDGLVKFSRMKSWTQNVCLLFKANFPTHFGVENSHDTSRSLMQEIKMGRETYMQMLSRSHCSIHLLRMLSIVQTCMHFMNMSFFWKGSNYIVYILK